MKVVVVGAGIAGCAAYLELQARLPNSSGGNHEITIYDAYNTDLDMSPNERQKTVKTHSSAVIVGGGLGIAPNGLNVLRRLNENLLKDVVRGGYVVTTSNIKNKNGWTLLSMQPTGPELQSKVTDDPERMHMVACSRHSLWKSLRARIPDEHILNRRVREVVIHDHGKNILRFADGSPEVEADLVIGADGVKSTVKKALFPDAQGHSYPPQYEGLVGVGGFIPSAEVRDFVEKGSMNFVFGGNGFFGYIFSESESSAEHRDSPYHVSEPGDSLAWWSTYEVEECPDPKALDMDAVTRQLRERHASWKDPVIQRILNSLRVENVWPTWTSPPLPAWERGGVVLVGDAAHALPPTSGQGSSQALEDVEAFALFLAHHLRTNDPAQDAVNLKATIKTAAKQYEVLRKPRVTAILKDAQQRQSQKRDMGWLQEYSMYAFIKLMGLFPSFMTRKLQGLLYYNIADEVARVLSAGQ